MKDYLIKGFVMDGKARIYLSSSTDVLNEAIRRHDIYPSSASCLGKIISMALLMGANLKGEEALTIKYNCNGPVGNLIADADALGNVRAYLDHPHCNFVNNKGGLNEQLTLGDEGFLDVIKDLKLKDLFTSSIPSTGNIANDFSNYFFTSEQSPSIVILSTLIDVDNLAKSNGGIIIQLMPGYTEDDINNLLKITEGIKSASALFTKDSLEDIATSLFSDFEKLDERTVSFKCNCSKERFIQGLYTLPTSELEEIVKDGKDITTICHYCNEEYVITIPEIQEIIKEQKEKQA